MSFDILLPSALFFLTAAAVSLYPKLETKVKSVLAERKFSVRDVVVLVVVMGVAVTVFVFIPSEAIRVLFLVSYSLLLFLSMYVMVSKWYIGVVLPAVFLALYFALWNALPSDMVVLIFMDVFAAIFVVFVAVFMGTLFGWETVAVFAGLLTVMDIIQVWVTGFMIQSSFKMQNLKLPITIYVPTFPYQSLGMLLGLGDILLSSLLTIQTARKYGRRFGYVSIVFIAAAFLVFEFLMFQFETGAMPATVFIVCGWLVALAARHIYNRLTAKKTLGEEQ